MRTALIGALALLVACDLPPLSLRFKLTGGDSQQCIGDTGNETTDCAEVSMLCTGVLSVRVVAPAEPDVPFTSVCKALNGKNLCSIASIDLPLPTNPVPAQVLEVQMAVFESTTLSVDDNGDPICPPVQFGANNLAVSAVNCADTETCVPQPAVAGRAFYHPGDDKTVVELGCANPALLNTCNPINSLEVIATVNDFETAVSVAPAAADRLVVSVGEPVPDPFVTGFVLFGATPLLRTVIEPIPGWSTHVDDTEFKTSVCIQVIEDASGATATLTCTSPVSAPTVDEVGYRLPRTTLAQILAALGLPSLPLEGLVVGIVLNEFFTPVQGATVTSDLGTIKYLSADRMSVTTTSTSSNGIFISQDAVYGSKFHWNNQEEIGGVVQDKVTIVVLKQPINL